MPVNAPVEYYKAEDKFRNGKSKEEKILYLEEMIRLLPKHHGSEQMHAQLKSRLAKLKKELESARKRGGGRKIGITKEGDAQVCLLGFTMSGKSWLLSKLTDARPEIAEHPYTTSKPVVGMMDYNGIKIQLVEIPATFGTEYLAISRTSELIALVVKNEKETKELEKVLEERLIRKKHIVVNPWKESTDEVRRKIWSALDLILVYTKTKGKLSPMALKRGSVVRDFAERIHKDFVKNFRFARIQRDTRNIQAGLNYKLEDGDVVEIHAL